MGTPSSHAERIVGELFLIQVTGTTFKMVQYSGKFAERDQRLAFLNQQLIELNQKSAIYSQQLAALINNYQQSVALNQQSVAFNQQSVALNQQSVALNQQSEALCQQLAAANDNRLSLLKIFYFDNDNGMQAWTAMILYISRCCYFNSNSNEFKCYYNNIPTILPELVAICKRNNGRAEELCLPR